MTGEAYRMFTDCGAGCRKLFELEIIVNPIESVGVLRPSARPERPNSVMAVETLTSGPVNRPPEDTRLMEAAERLEAGFLAEMLKSAGLGAVPDQFGGGAGEEHFASFMIEAQAREMVQAGGIGLAQSLFEAMKAREDD